MMKIGFVQLFPSLKEPESYASCCTVHLCTNFGLPCASCLYHRHESIRYHRVRTFDDKYLLKCKYTTETINNAHKSST